MRVLKDMLRNDHTQHSLSRGNQPMGVRRDYRDSSEIPGSVCAELVFSALLTTLGKPLSKPAGDRSGSWAGSCRKEGDWLIKFPSSFKSWRTRWQGKPNPPSQPGHWNTHLAKSPTQLYFIHSPKLVDVLSQSVSDLLQVRWQSNLKEKETSKKSELQEPTVLKSITRSTWIRHPCGIHYISPRRSCFKGSFLLLASSLPVIPSSVVFADVCVARSSHVKVSLGLISPHSMHSPWEILPTHKCSPPSKYISSHGLSSSSDPWFQPPAGFPPPKWTQYGIQRWSHYLSFKSHLFLSLFLFSPLVEWPHHCFKPGSYSSVFPFGIPHHIPNLINHKIYHVYFLSIFLKGPCLYITQPHFHNGPLQEPHGCSPQRPTDVFVTLWPEW